MATTKPPEIDRDSRWIIEQKKNHCYSKVYGRRHYDCETLRTLQKGASCQKTWLMEAPHSLIWHLSVYRSPKYMLKNRDLLCSNNFSSFTWKHTIRIYYNIEKRYKTSTVRVHKSS